MEGHDEKTMTFLLGCRFKTGHPKYISKAECRLQTVQIPRQASIRNSFSARSLGRVRNRLEYPS